MKIKINFFAIMAILQLILYLLKPDTDNLIMLSTFFILAKMEEDKSKG
jgi:hypothetical protein